MLKKRSQLLLSLLCAGDLVISAGTWLGAYALVREFSPERAGDVAKYLAATPVVLLAVGLSLWQAGLYKPRRTGMFMAELFDLARANMGAFIVLLAVPFFLRNVVDPYSRWVAGLFLMMNTVALALERGLVREALWKARQRGFNLRYVLVVGAGKLGQQVVERIAKNPWAGLAVKGYLDDDPARRGKTFLGAPVLGGIDELADVIGGGGIDQVFVALPLTSYDRLKFITDTLAQQTVDLRIIPDLYGFVTLNAQVGEFDGLPVLSLRESPLVGWNHVVKRVFDIVLSVLILAVLSPLMALVALLVKLTSPGPVFYRQERMGLDGRRFGMLKFRTMRADAEDSSGAVWAKREDPRVTRLGRLLRRLSLDETPQFINVLAGDMSIVGPRPERPVFIEDFKKSVPRYMLRHKTKAGITGWAQVNGWRGNTSLEKRIQYDLYYIENWSVWFDLQIMFLTVFSPRTYRDAY